jgi:cytochrome P450
MGLLMPVRARAGTRGGTEPGPFVSHAGIGSRVIHRIADRFGRRPPGNLAKMEGQIRERTARVLDGLPRNETFDWVDRVSVELTTMMLATLFDYPWDERRQLTYWSDVAVANVRSPESPVHSEEEKFAELTKMTQALGKLFNERARQPPKFDLLSMLAHGEATREMPFREFMGTLSLLIVGGNDTTRNSMTGGLMALSQHSGEYQKLRDDPGLIPGMVPEIIRYVTPVIHMRRTAKEDVELGGKQIRKGDKVVMWYVSGNRDPEAIKDNFIIDRARPRQRLSFGFGIHRCVGNRLAELQLRILWEELMPRFPVIEVMGPARRIYSDFIHGIRSLPVRILAQRRHSIPIQCFAPMAKDFASFDCDAHVIEPPLIWERAKDFLTHVELHALQRTIWWDADGRLLIVNGRAGIGLGTPRKGGTPGTMRVITNAGPGVEHDIQRALNVRNLNPKTALTQQQVAYLDHAGSYEPKPRLSLAAA